MSDRESVTAESRWSELYRWLLAPGTVAYALAPTGRSNEPVKVGAGNASELITEAEKAGAGRAVWAVVAPLRPDLLVVDLDECADVMWPAIRDAAEDYGAAVAHVAASGRPNCLHVALAPTPAARIELVHTIARTFEFHRPALPASAAADIRGRKPIRLPGSCSLKGAAPCVSVDTDTLRPITAVAAARRAADAVQQTPPRVSDVNTVATGNRAFVSPSLESAESDSALQTEAPRAWRARQRLSAEDWSVLNNASTHDRSLAATEGAWRLWQHGIRSFAAARWWYERMPCFGKFRERDLEAHEQRGGRGPMRWEACGRHWSSIVRRARAHQPTIPAQDQAVIDAALSEVSRWNDYELAATAEALIHERFANGHGIHARPVARRDLSMLMHFTDGTATRVLRELQRRQLLQLVEQWPASNPRHANLYTLSIPSPIYRGKPAHDVTSPLRSPSLLHPLWACLGHTERALWTALSSSSPQQSTSSLATRLGLPRGDHSYGVLRALHRLAELGLVSRIGRGRGTSWTLNSAVTLDAAAEAIGAADRSEQLHARVIAERRCWHSETRSEQARSRRGLAVLRARLTHADAQPTSPAGLFAVSTSWPPTSQARRRREGLGGAVSGADGPFG